MWILVDEVIDPEETSSEIATFRRSEYDMLIYTIARCIVFKWHVRIENICNSFKFNGIGQPMI